MSNLLRLGRVKEKTGLGTTSIYARVTDGLITPPIKITKRCSAWPEHEIDEINRARIAGQGDEQIRELVVALLGRRKAGQLHSA